LLMKTLVVSRVRILLTLVAVGAALLYLRAREPAGSREQLAPVLKPFIERHAVAGVVVLVADKDKVLDLEAVGYADVAAKKPMTTDALFWIASQSKSMTATAFMMLVDEGKVHLDDAVEKYLPEFKSVKVAVLDENGRVELRKPKHPITVRQILSHTSGLPFTSPREKPTLDTLTLAEAVRSYAATPLHSEPGTRYAYSNAGINTAGRIIEVVSGMPYEKFMDKRLFEPLGMKDTTFWPNAEQLKRLARSYRPNKDKTDLVEVPIGQLRYPLSERTRQPMPAGGLFSTARDVGRFCQMILNGGTFEGKRYLSEAAVRQMTSKQTGDKLKEQYGLGWSTGGGNPGHGGAHATNMTILPKRGLVLVYMVQETGGFPKDGKECAGAFHQEALKHFGKKK
jgi:CubicO group peptidase (beta-lactamase class C family)